MRMDIDSSYRMELSLIFLEAKETSPCFEQRQESSTMAAIVNLSN